MIYILKNSFIFSRYLIKKKTYVGFYLLLKKFIICKCFACHHFLSKKRCFEAYPISILLYKAPFEQHLKFVQLVRWSDDHRDLSAAETLTFFQFAFFIQLFYVFFVAKIRGNWLQGFFCPVLSLVFRSENFREVAVFFVSDFQNCKKYKGEIRYLEIRIRL